MEAEKGGRNLQVTLKLHQPLKWIQSLQKFPGEILQ